jgi:hypothetical protein
MLNFSSIQATNPQFFNKKVSNFVMGKKNEVLPVSEVTLNKIRAALSSGKWLTFTEIQNSTGFVSGTVSRAARYLVRMGGAVTKADSNGQARNSYLKLT